MPDFEPLYTSEEMRAAEKGHDTSVLMERAGAAAAQIALQVFAGAERWTVVCGGGANGGDGRITARHLEQAGKRVHVVDAKAGETELGEPHVIVDALFGTGFACEPDRKSVV
jgi:NAD(P)H-hydrate repair Nnr-like enzyme with NAD(P)H-hydrate epimerase domain